MPVLYAVSPIGLGHASRAIAVGLKLRERRIGLEFATGGRAAAFIRSYGFTAHDVITEPVPSEKDGVMRNPTLWYLKYWRGYRASRTRVSSLMSRLKPDLVVGDEEFSSVSLAIEQGVKNVLISDELELNFARTSVSRYVERRVGEWYARLQHEVSHLLIPDFGTDHNNIHFTTPIVRAVSKSRDEVRKELGLDTDSRLVLFSASGSGIGDFILENVVKTLRSMHDPRTELVVTGVMGGKSDGNVHYVGLQKDNQNLVAAADLVISTAGKSTIDEAASFGTPMIAIPIKNHSEQERNADSLGFTYDDRHRLSELIPKFLSKRTVPRNYQGAEIAAQYLGRLT